LIPGLDPIGEAHFSGRGASRLGASALMQGLADGYFILPYTIGDYLASEPLGSVSTDRAEFAQVEQEVRARTERLLSVGGKTPVDHFHRKLGRLMWDHVGMSRNRAGLERTLQELPGLREQFWREVGVTGQGETLNQCLERAGRVADFLEFAELIA